MNDKRTDVAIENAAKAVAMYGEGAGRYSLTMTRTGLRGVWFDGLLTNDLVEAEAEAKALRATRAYGSVRVADMVEGHRLMTAKKISAITSSLR